MARARRAARVKVGDLAAAVDALAPAALAADWDNVGLLAGRPEWPVRRVRVALDLTDAVAEEALAARADALVLYHPPLFKGTRRITAEAEGPTTRLPDLLARRVSLLATHTALDAAPGGTNDVLLDAFAPVARWPLQPVTATAGYKLVVFAPPADVDRLRLALAAGGAGVIGHYEECSFMLRGTGTFRGDETTRPAVGTRGRLEHADEVRLEMVVPAARVGDVVRALYATHRYEEPAYDLYPVESVAGRAAAGLGRVGRLARPATGRVLVRRLGRVADLGGATVVGDLRRRFTSVTTAAGAFEAGALCDPESLVVTGELRHHDALQLLRRGVTAVVLGHDTSERPVLDVLRDGLRARLAGVEIEIARAVRPVLAPLGRERGVSGRRRA